MRALLLCVGRCKEDWQRAACAEYLKRLTRYGTYELREVPDQPDELGRRAMEIEGQALLKQIRPDDLVVALCIEGEAPDSPGLARKISEWEMTGKRLVLVVGGSQGLAEAVLDRAERRLSFSHLTFPHQLMRVILLEQLYRAARINAGEKYHK